MEHGVVLVVQHLGREHGREVGCNMQGGNHLGVGRVRQGRLWSSESQGVPESEGCQHQLHPVLHPASFHGHYSALNPRCRVLSLLHSALTVSNYAATNSIPGGVNTVNTRNPEMFCILRSSYKVVRYGLRV